MQRVVDPYSRRVYDRSCDLPFSVFWRLVEVYTDITTTPWGRLRWVLVGSVSGHA